MSLVESTINQEDYTLMYSQITELDSHYKLNTSLSAVQHESLSSQNTESMLQHETEKSPMLQHVRYNSKSSQQHSVLTLFSTLHALFLAFKAEPNYIE